MYALSLFSNYIILCCLPEVSNRSVTRTLDWCPDVQGSNLILAFLDFEEKKESRNGWALVKPHELFSFYDVVCTSQLL